MTLFVQGLAKKRLALCVNKCVHFHSFQSIEKGLVFTFQIMDSMWGGGGDNCADTQTGQLLELGDTPEDLGQLK